MFPLTYLSESCGEDIRETESERSADSSGDEFDDDFIDDGEPEVFPPSPSPGLQGKRLAFLNCVSSDLAKIIIL